MVRECEAGLAKFRDPRKMVEKLLVQLECGDNVRQLEALYQMGVTLEKEGSKANNLFPLLRTAAWMFGACRSPGEYWRCLPRKQASNGLLMLAVEDQPEALRIVETLTALTLFSQARSCCF